MTCRIASFRSSLVLCAALVTAATVAPRSARAQSDTTDPRAHLKPGLYDAGEAAKGLQLVAHVNKPDDFHPNDPGGLTYANSDLAFGGHYVYQGNFSGFQIWDISNPAKPVLTNHVVCFTEQGDVSVYGHLLFVSAENTGSRLDCGTQGIQDSVSKERMVGVRIFDISNPKAPKQVADVQTCRGSHTHTLVQDPTDKRVIYVYVSGLARVRSTSDMAGCEGLRHAGNDGVLDEFQRIRGPGVFGDFAGMEIHQALVGIDGDVFEDGSEADGVVDLGLVFAREMDALGIASALEIEDTAVTPAVLVIADEAAARVGGESGFAGAGETEEERNVTVHAEVG